MNVKVISSLILIVVGTIMLVLTLRESGYNASAKIFVFGILIVVGLYQAWIYEKSKK